MHMEWMHVLSNPIALVGMKGATCNAVEMGKSTMRSQLPGPSTVSDRAGPTVEAETHRAGHVCECTDV